MELVTRIVVDGYRCFDTFDAGGFTRINLIVGKNNVGKTALLEALEIGLCRHLGRILLQSIRREEYYSPVSALGQMALGTDRLLDVRQLFNGRSLPVGQKLGLRLYRGGSSESFVFHRDGAGLRAPQWQALRVIEDAAVSVSEASRIAGDQGPEPTSIRSLDPARMTAYSLAKHWTQEVVRRKAEAAVVEAVRTVEPAIEDVTCIDTEGRLGGSSFLIGLRGLPARIPLGSLGEGVGRVFRLAVTAVAARDGALLVDEIESGLHHSVFPMMWSWLVGQSMKTDGGFQLFATTHSEDCVNALAKLVSATPELDPQVSVHRIEPTERTMRRFSGLLAADAVESMVEVRG
jgi:hypothetical protein